MLRITLVRDQIERLEHEPDLSACLCVFGTFDLVGTTVLTGCWSRA